MLVDPLARDACRRFSARSSPQSAVTRSPCLRSPAVSNSPLVAHTASPLPSLLPPTAPPNLSAFALLVSTNIHHVVPHRSASDSDIRCADSSESVRPPCPVLWKRPASCAATSHASTPLDLRNRRLRSRLVVAAPSLASPRVVRERHARRPAHSEAEAAHDSGRVGHPRGRVPRQTASGPDRARPPRREARNDSQGSPSVVPEPQVSFSVSTTSVALFPVSPRRGRRDHFLFSEQSRGSVVCVSRPEVQTLCTNNKLSVVNAALTMFAPRLLSQAKREARIVVLVVHHVDRFRPQGSRRRRSVLLFFPAAVPCTPTASHRRLVRPVRCLRRSERFGGVGVSGRGRTCIFGRLRGSFRPPRPAIRHSRCRQGECQIADR